MNSSVERLGGCAALGAFCALFILASCSESVPPDLALKRAAFAGDIDRVESLLATGLDPNSRAGERGGTALAAAADGGRCQVVSYLLTHGADPNFADERGYTPLMGAASIGSEECVALLVSAGADVNAVLEDARSTALGIAAMRGHMPVVRRLLEAKADPSVSGANGLVPADVAHRQGYFEVERVLREALDIKVQNGVAQ